MPNSEKIRSRLVTEMMIKAEHDCVEAIVKNFKLAYRTSDSPIDLQYLSEVGPLTALCEFSLHIHFQCLARIMTGTFVFDLAPLEEVLKAYDYSCSVYRERLVLELTAEAEKKT